MELTIINRISDRLDQLKKEKGITRTWIAEQMGISRQALTNLSKIENPNIKTLEILARLTGYKVTDFYEVDVK